VQRSAVACRVGPLATALSDTVRVSPRRGDRDPFWMAAYRRLEVVDRGVRSLLNWPVTLVRRTRTPAAPATRGRGPDPDGCPVFTVQVGRGVQRWLLRRVAVAAEEAGVRYTVGRDPHLATVSLEFQRQGTAGDWESFVHRIDWLVSLAGAGGGDIS
jgi:hypothetical protein